MTAKIRFLREDGNDDPDADQWEDKMAKKYYDSLFREYAVCDLKHYKSGNVRRYCHHIPLTSQFNEVISSLLECTPTHNPIVCTTMAD